MAAAEVTFLQNPVLTKFVYPFLLIFFIIFAILEKSKLFGDDKKQLNALIAFVIGFIFVSAVFPKEMATNLMLFLTIAVVVVFVILVLWGFIMGEGGLKIFDNSSKGLKWAIGIFIILVVTIAVLWAAGVDIWRIFNNIFNMTWSSTFWTNVVFIVLVAIALAVVLRSGKKP
jgi:hypothetical protein